MRQSNTIREEKRREGKDKTPKCLARLAFSECVRRRGWRRTKDTRRERIREGGRRLSGPIAQPHKCLALVASSGSSVKTLAQNEQLSKAHNGSLSELLSILSIFLPPAIQFSIPTNSKKPVFLLFLLVRVAVKRAKHRKRQGKKQRILKLHNQGTNKVLKRIGLMNITTIMKTCNCSVQ